MSQAQLAFEWEWREEGAWKREIVEESALDLLVHDGLGSLSLGRLLSAILRSGSGNVGDLREPFSRDAILVCGHGRWHCTITICRCVGGVSYQINGQ